MAIYDPTKKLAPSFDTHSHLNAEELFFDVPAYISRANEFQVNDINVVGYDLLSSQKAIELSEKYEQLHAIVGWQPDDASTFDFTWLSQKAKSKEIVGIGETGLDYYHEGFNKNIQRQSFEQHLEIAQKNKLPVTIHTRNSHEDMVSILKNANLSVPIVMHSFAGTTDEVQDFLNLDAYISFSGIVTFKNAKEVHEAAQHVPLNRLLVETDAPYLAPTPFRGRVNEPMLVTYVVEQLSNLLEITRDDIANQTTTNAKKVWKI